MNALQFLNHLANLVFPGLGTGLGAAAITKLLWWRQLASVSYLRLAAWASVSGCAAAIGGVVIFGRDGRMLTYLLMVSAIAISLAFSGWGKGAQSSER